MSVKHEHPSQPLSEGKPDQFDTPPAGLPGAEANGAHEDHENRLRAVNDLMMRVEREVPASSDEARAVASDLHELASRITVADQELSTIDTGVQGEKVDTPLNTATALDIIRQADKGADLWKLDETQRDAWEKVAQAESYDAVDDIDGLPFDPRAKYPNNVPREAVLRRVKAHAEQRLALDQELRAENVADEPVLSTPEPIGGTQLYPKPVYPTATDYEPKHAHSAGKPTHKQHESKHAASDGKTGNEYEANDENLTALEGEAGVKVMEEMNDIIRQADREKRTLTKDEQSMLSLVVAAMDANDLGKEKGSRGGVIYNLRDRNQAYADQSKRRDNVPTAEQLKSALEDISDLEGDAGVRIITKANEFIQEAERKGEPLATHEQLMIARANAAMEKYGLHSKLKWHQIDRLRKTDERLAEDQDRGEDDLSDLEGKAGLKEMDALNKLIKEAEQARRPLTDDEKARLSRVIAAMDKYGLDNSDEKFDTLSDSLQRISDRLRSTSYASELPELPDNEGKELVHVPGEEQQPKGLRRFVSRRWQETKENVKGWSTRKKIGVAAAAVAVAGFLGYGVAENVEHYNNRAETEEVDPGSVTPPSYLGGSIESGAPATKAESGDSERGDATSDAETDEGPGEIFTVDPVKSPGFTYTFMDAANKAGLDITTKQSYEEVYEPLVAEGYISEDSKHIKGVRVFPMSNGDFGFAGTGEVEYSHQMMQRMYELIEEAAERNK